jgi:DNA mismatch repair protein MutS2
MNTSNSHPFAHAAAALGLREVLALVGVECVNHAARDTIATLRPSSDAAWIRERLAEIDEYRELREASGDIVIPETGYRGAVERIAQGERGDGVTLRRIADGEHAVGELQKSVRERRESSPLLYAIAAGARPDDALVRDAYRALDSDGNVRDDATPELKAIRRDLASARNSLRERSEKLVNEFGADSHATVISGRHVLVVPRARVKRGTGLVHGASQSGGSLYVEPLSLLDLNNELETRLADEQEEIDRILRALSDRVRDSAPGIIANADVIDRLDVIRAVARFADSFGCVTPDIVGSRIHMVRARHPLLLVAMSRAGTHDRQVPLDLTLDTTQRLMIVTGPNAGGKTVALKTVGLLSLMLQCGLPVPVAHGTEMPVFERIYADIGDEQSLESSLSTFTSHLAHLDEMTRNADRRTLCLIDEIGDGTDPDEGAAIAIATLEQLLRSGAAVIATTHYGRIKTFALETDGVANASMAFEDETSRPLYRLLEGIAGRSRGIQTARRVGFASEIVDRAEAILGGEAFRLEAALARLEAAHVEWERERDRLEVQRIELERTLASSKEKEQSYTLTKKEATRRAAREAEELLAKARREAEDTVRLIREGAAKKENIREGRQRIEKALEEVRAHLQPENAFSPLDRVAKGDKVSLSPTGSPWGIVVEVERKDAMVDMGGKRIRVKVTKLYPAVGVEPGEGRRAETRPVARVEYEPLSEMEIMVRGMDRESALDEVSKFIDRAVLTGLNEVKIIHGFGEQILARAVKDALSRDPRVRSWRNAAPHEGGLGVTFATLR